MNVLFTILRCLSTGIQVFLASFLFQPLFLLLISRVSKALPRSKPPPPPPPPQKNYPFTIVITSHQETSFLPPIVDSLIKQTYPHFQVWIIADDCDPRDIRDLRFDDPRVTLLQPPTAFHSKTRSIEYALSRSAQSSRALQSLPPTESTSVDEILVIFDPDNLVHPRFLEVLNAWYNKGFQAVQGNLCPKNSKEKYEKMDNLGVLFNNFIDRDTRSLLGLSGNIWGCGVSVYRDIYEKIIYDNRSRTGGFDKHMQAEIAKSVSQIGYAADAILYDEKVRDGLNLETQRTRWIRAYFHFLVEAFRLFFTGIRKLDFNLAYFGYNLTRPPYFLQVLIALLFIAINFFVSAWVFCIAWIIALSAFICAFVVIVNTSGRTASEGIRYMPLLFYHQVMALLKQGRSKGSFLKTRHSKILYIDDLLKHESTG